MAALAAGGLAYEIALTRLLSALLLSNWVAPVLAAALLGLGLGAAAASARPGLRSPTAAALAAATAPATAAIGVVATLAAAYAGAPLWGLAPLVLTYACIGLAMAATFARHASFAAPLYRADLAAAAAAAALTPLVLGRLGGLQGSLAAALLLALAAWALGLPDRRWPSAIGTLVAAAATVAAALGMLELDPGALGTPKSIRATLDRGGVIEATRWDATARTDLVLTPDGARYLFMDGGAGSLVPGPDPRRWWHDVGAFAFAITPADRVLLIGSGAGLDVAQARAHGVERVVAVEINRASVELVRALGDAAGRVYDAPTEVHVGEGRRVLAHLEGAFDVITLAHVVTGAAELRGAALTENRVYTLEAFGEFLARLTPGGRLSLTLYDELTLTRAVITALEALVAGGWAADPAAAMGHLFAVLDANTTPPVPLLLVRPSPFTRDEAIAAARVAEARGWSLLQVPGLLAPPSLAAVASGELSPADLVAASADVNLRPTSDERPYFFAFEPGVPRDVRFAGGLALLLLGALALASAPVGTGTRGAGSTSAAARRWLSAALLGGAFLAAELHALQLLQRGAGHPAWSLALTLGALLLGGALGAGWVARQPRGSVAGPAALAAVGVAAWTTLAPPLVAVLDPWPPALAGAALALALVAVGVPLGMPFPRLLAAFPTGAGVAAAWAASGLGAVAAGAGGLWLGHAIGVSALGAAAALAYLVVAALRPPPTVAEPAPEP